MLKQLSNVLVGESIACMNTISPAPDPGHSQWVTNWSYLLSQSPNDTERLKPPTIMYKILLLTDFSAASRHALSFAQALFADTATDFCLTNAFPFEPEMSYGGAFWLEEEQQETKKVTV